LSATEIEKQHLEAHVELCQERYQQLDKRLSVIEDKVERIHNDILTGNKAMIKVFIGAAATIIVGFLSTVVVILDKLN
jgi:tetrahydromethanopterin S-methyltransferase subunit G